MARSELPEPTPHNLQLRLYTKAMRKVADANELPFVDLFTPTLALMNDRKAERLTFNGIHLTAYGYWAVSLLLAEGLGMDAPAWSLGGLLRWQSRIVLDPAAGALAESGLGGGDTLGMVAAEVHVQSHLLICGGASGHVGPR